jgi:glycosyltransferase involved in cell wall biosynthesis
LKILLLNQTFYPDVVATAQYLGDLAAALAQRGHQVTVVAGRRAYDDLQRRFPKDETWRGVQIHRVSSTRFGKGAKWRRAADFASFILSCCWRMLRLPRQDAILTLTSPPLISFIGAAAARLSGAKFYYWVMDLNPDEAVAAGWLREDSPLTGLLQALSRFSFRRAERIIVLDRFMRERIEKKGIDPQKIEVIAPWARDGEIHFDAAGRGQFRRAHGLEDKFVVMHSGNHSPCHPLDTLLATAKAMAGEERFLFLFAGGGSEFAKVGAFAAENRLNNILCLPYQPAGGLSASLSAADLHVVVMGEPFVGIIHPCKIYNILAVAAPILFIGPQTSHVGEILRGLNSNVCGRVEPGGVDECAAIIRRIAAAGARGEPAAFKSATAEFSAGRLLPGLVALLEGAAPGAAK